ncbi:hypothetical protein [Sphingomonas sp.]|uniref:hypothetical protein n=1 Tax=Sphingomonas sp. TaxID=28214 RepID=UPI00286D35EA|nr:hypothetical protein [Sphingomonas sp.]
MAIERIDIERITVVAFGLIVPAIIGSSLTIFNDGDIHWHIAAGQWILDHRAVPTVDPFSFTFGGRPWMAFEWGSQLIYGGAYRLEGYAGVAAVVTGLLVALHLIIIANARRWLGPMGVAITIILLNLVIIPMTLARPHMFGWVLLALWLHVLLKAREQSRAPPLIAAALMILWVNLHGSFAIGLVIAAIFALDACIEARWRWPVVRGWLLFGIGSALGAMITPNGIDGFLYPLSVAQLKTLPLIVEWRPSDWSRTPYFFVAIGLAALLMAWRGVKLRLVIAGLLALLLLMAFHQMRHQAVLAIVAAMLLPKALGRAERGALFDHAHRWRIAVGAGAAIAALLLFRATLPLEPTENGAYPRSAIAALPADLRAAPGLNDYSFGGPLIQAGIKPYIDGRSDMYGDAFFADYQRILDGDRGAFDRAATHHGLRYTMLAPRYAALIARLDSDPAWQRIYADQIAIIHRRR